MRALWRVFCFIVGHKRSGKDKRVDRSRRVVSMCRRCGIAMERGPQGWKVAKDASITKAP